MISPLQRPLPGNTQHSQQTNIHAPDGIRTHNPSRQAAEDLRLRPRGHWDRLSETYYAILFIIMWPNVLSVELPHHKYEVTLKLSSRLTLQIDYYNFGGLVMLQNHFICRNEL